MTICTAAIFKWSYDSTGTDVGPAIITASDRMLTDEGLKIQFDRNYMKVARLTDKAIALVAASIPVQSEILKRYAPTINTPQQERDIPKIARGYGKAIRDYRAESAAENVLSVFKLDNETFLTRQREMKDSFVMQLANDMADYKIGAEAIIAGCDDKRAHLYHVDSMGAVTCHDDVGFVSAGIGGVHATAQFMLAEYVNTWPYYWALYMTYMAKKRGEAAPGCGPTTDMHVVNRDGWWAIDPRTIGELDQMYKDQQEAREKLIKDSAGRLIEFDKRTMSQPKDPPPASETEISNGGASKRPDAKGEPAS